MISRVALTIVFAIITREFVYVAIQVEEHVVFLVIIGQDLIEMVCLLFLEEWFFRADIFGDALVYFLDLLGDDATDVGDAAVCDRESG